MGAPAVPGGQISTERLGDAFLFLTVATSGVVMFEPAPYDLLLTIYAVVAFAMGLALPRAMAPLVVLLLLFNIGGILSVTQVQYWTHPDKSHPLIFVGISLMLMVNAIVFAAVCADRPHRMNLILKATLAAAVIAALLGVVGYGLKIEALMRYGRAKGPFKDPNVFGPFLVLPLIWMVRAIMMEGVTRHLGKVVWSLVILAGIFLSMSRAAWGLTAGCLVMIGFVLFVDERDARRRLRLIAMALAGLLAAALLILVVLSLGDVAELFQERAKLVQYYDGARLGRFARHWLGFLFATELPLGLGPYQFDHYFPEDPHNVFLKSLMVYGWLGFLAYTVLAFWTIFALFPSIFLPRPWKPVAQVVWVVLVGHQVVSWIIDTDHWRHFFLLWGLAWAIIVLEKRHRRAHRIATAPPPVAAPPT